ncbi:MAG: serpin family protein [Salinivirgaceae bacterium]|nr:serpin family protein [Salinivirgaceae bacterium]
MRRLAAACLAVAAFVSAQGQGFTPLSRDMNGFAVAAYAKLADGGDANFVFSPLSLNLAMRMVEEGARGNTAVEIGAVLNPSESAEQIGRNSKQLIVSLEGKGEGGLTLANSVWVKRGYKILPSYTDVIKDCYQATCDQLNFSSRRACRQSCATVNRWVSARTGGKITKLLTDDMVNANTRMVLVNAISFKCDWLHKFKPENSKAADFHQIDGRTALTTFMSQTENYGYCKGTDYEAVELTYADTRFAMLILVPAEGRFADVEAQLIADFVQGVADSLSDERVALSMPKFDAATSVDFSQILRQLGIVDAFGGKADFSGMSGKKDLQLSKVVQKAVIEVDETGTEAAAATAATMMVKSAFFPKLKHLTIDRPFVYFIRDTQTNIILFAGRYTKVQ